MKLIKLQHYDDDNLQKILLDAHKSSAKKEDHFPIVSKNKEVDLNPESFKCYPDI